MAPSDSLPAALVTGGSRGIGRGIALALGKAGHAIVVGYARRADAAAEVVGQIEQAGGRAVAVQGDVCLEGDRARWIDAALSHFGRLDLLINNAGITSPGRRDLLEATEASFDLVWTTNLKGPFFLAQIAAKAMIGLIRAGAIARGTIVNMSSISAYTVSTDRADYCLAKAALGMMTQLFAARLAEEAISVFELRPGVIATDMTAPVAAKYDRLIAEGLTPIRRWGQVSDIAAAVLAISQGAFPFSTGQVFDIDGGYHIRRLH
ncbi:MAG: 3-ketoacyl-ACP reductase [Pirellulales bacterium]|nr:3-ketoacyl-ACP reductase [Pirellulales bacterium]